MENPNIIVLFELKPTAAGLQRYLELAAELKTQLADLDGFIRVERFSSLSEEGKFLSMSIWRDEEAVKRWRNTIQHRLTQREGRENLFESYTITVCSTLRSYTHDERTQAPSDSNLFHRV